MWLWQNHFKRMYTQWFDFSTILQYDKETNDWKTLDKALLTARERHASVLINAAKLDCINWKSTNTKFN